MQALRLDHITLDTDLQPRAEIDQDAVRDYAEALAGGAQFPRVVVFLDGATCWLADGYHRWHAHKQAGVQEIAVRVVQGSKQDAIRHSLSANAQHGKQRGAADFKKAYDIACRHDLVVPSDADAVRELLQCSIRWARDLTKDARDAADRKRDDAIRAARATGQSVKQVAAKVGVSAGLVSKVAPVHERKTAVCERPAPVTAAPLPRPQADPAAPEPVSTRTSEQEAADAAASQRAGALLHPLEEIVRIGMTPAEYFAALDVPRFGRFLDDSVDEAWRTAWPWFEQFNAIWSAHRAG